MFKGKKNAIVLLAINLIVWSYFVSTLFIHDEQVSTTKIKNFAQPKFFEENSKDETLLLNYKDPFLSNTSDALDQTSLFSGTDRQVQPTVKTEVQPVILPNPSNYKYLGMTRNKASNKITAILSIDGQNSYVTLNDQIGDLKITRIQPDSLYMSNRSKKISLGLYSN